MGRPIVYGADYSVYVRIVRLALAEKQVAYDLVPVDIFATDGAPDWYAQKHPFGRIPAFEHDGFTLYETSAICRYVDEAFDGPRLQPAESRMRATMNQVIGLIDAYAYRTMVWDLYVETVSKPAKGDAVDEAVVDRAMPIAKTCLAELARLKRDGDWLLGDALSLADVHLAPVFDYFVKAPAAESLLAPYAALKAWHDRMRRRDGAAITPEA